MTGEKSLWKNHFWNREVINRSDTLGLEKETSFIGLEPSDFDEN